MIISHEHKFIFVHIGRTAGTSVEDSLLRAMGVKCPTQTKGERPELILNSLYNRTESLCPELRHFVGRKHATLEQLKELAGARAYHDYFKFATVRNPWDHELSIYTKAQSRIHGEKARKSSFSKNDFDIHLVKRHALRRRHRFSTYMDFFSVNGSIALDAVIRFESLEQDFQNTCATIGLEAKLSHNGDESRARNAAGATEYREYYSFLGKRLVGHFRHNDTMWLGYQF